MSDDGDNDGWGHVERQGPQTSLVVKAAVRERLGGRNVSADFYDALEEEVMEMLTEAAERAEDNDRKTVQPRDL